VPDKLPFDIPVMLDRIGTAVADKPKAALFELADQGYGSAFEQLIACIISIRTLDEVMLPTALRLFEVGRTPAAVAELSVERIDELIGSCSFHYGKAHNIKAIAERTVAEFGGELPCDYATLTSFKGVGPKCAHLTLGIACGVVEGIGVDVHVHRVTNRWGYVAEPTPEATLEALVASLPKSEWVRINALLVPFGKHICTRARPHCSNCPVLAWCRQVGVVEPK
jgi:endonuclease-3